ncbi:hypothetical protein HGI15_20200, partial [Modestobacter lapidis]|nr:hypothetical protein [Modestobacter lapidis]
MLASANVARGYSSSCPAGNVAFDLTGHVAGYAKAKGSVMPLAILANEGDPTYWKKFNSGNNPHAVPAITVTYDGNCDLYNFHTVCGVVRDKYYAAGGPNGPLGVPTTNTTAIAGGEFNHFAGGSIYYSPGTGAHIISGPIRDKWASLGWEGSWLGYPTTDTTPIAGGSYSHFAGGSIYYSPGTGAHTITGPIRDKWAAMGWENSFVGYPTTDGTAITGGSFNHFTGGSIYSSPATGAHWLRGAIYDQWGERGWENSYLGFPTSDEYPVAAGARNDFTGGQITLDAATGQTLWTAGPSAFAGTPGWATTLDYQLADTLAATVNVGTGNLNLSVAGLTVPGIGGDRGIGVVYNSLHTAPGSVDPTGLLGAGFRLTESPDARLIPYAEGSVRYVDATGRAAVYEWNGGPAVYASPIGDGGTRLERDAATNNWVLTTLASHRKQTFRASDGLMIADTDRNGVAYTFSYDSAGKPTTITGTRGGAPVTFTFGGTGVPAGQLGKLSQTIDGATRTVVFGYDTTGRLTSIVDASGETTTFGWTGTDLTSITPPAGKSTAVSYDTGHRVTQVVRDPGAGGYNATTKLGYGSAGGALEVKVTDPNNHVTTYRGDAFGKIIEAKDPLGHVRATTYSPNNDVLTAVDAMPAANTTTYSYNGADGGFTPTGVTTPTGASATAGYPDSGTGPQRYLPDSGTDPQGNATTLSYDAAGNPTQQVSGGVTTSTTYNPPAGQPTVCAGGGKGGQPCSTTDGKGQTTTYTYDATGNLRTVTPPAAGVIEETTFSYDGAGRPRTVTDGEGQVTTYLYDAGDRVTQVRYDGATSCADPADCQVYDHDGNGNLVSRVDAAGTTSYSYDALNRLTSQTTPATSGGGAQTSTLSYDLAGNLLTFTDGLGATRYGYDAANNLINLAEPGGSCTGTVTRCTTYTYDPNGAREKITYPGGTVVDLRNIDGSGRPADYWAQAGNGAVVMDF